MIMQCSFLVLDNRSVLNITMATLTRKNVSAFHWFSENKAEFLLIRRLGFSELPEPCRRQESLCNPLDFSTLFVWDGSLFCVSHEWFFFFFLLQWYSFQSRYTGQRRTFAKGTPVFLICRKHHKSPFLKSHFIATLTNRSWQSQFVLN